MVGHLEKRLGAVVNRRARRNLLNSGDPVLRRVLGRVDLGVTERLAVGRLETPEVTTTGGIKNFKHRLALLGPRIDPARALGVDWIGGAR